MKKFFKSLLFPFPSLAIACWSAIGVFSLAPLFSPTQESYNSATGLSPESQKAKELVRKCEASAHFKDPEFNSSWRFSMMGGNVAYFHCAVEEKIDYRERSRLRLCASNPQQVYNWNVKVEL